MNYKDRTLQRAWTLSGRYFGYWDGDDLWSCQGRHVGRLRGAEIFAPDGRYIGEMMGNGRLAVRSRKLGTYGTAYIAWPPRDSDTLLPSLDPGTHRIGYEDFPSPSDFLPATAIMASVLPASILC
ncbi:MAG TPA: hypothetical protein VLV87_04390 [Gammaproteobacteria bacterium]|nr:hypothetical protein [Gammaproteobacteria bacterium]